jgi:hypothetical protein
VNPTPARGRGGPGPLFAPGFTLLEAIVWIVLATWGAALLVPGMMQLSRAVSIRSAASETTVAFFRARAYAIARNRNVGLKFRKNGPRWEWAIFGDGNGNGVRTSDIARGIDRYLGAVYMWDRNDVMPAIMTDVRVPDPGNPGHYLDRIDDPIRFNNSDICSFSPMGESTPGSVYLWDGHDRMGAVRVFGGTAKIRTLYYRRGERGWIR